MREGYIADRGVNGTGVTVVQLTKKGFDQIKHDLGELKELRFNPQSVTHDYWATAFQIGPFVHDKNGSINFVTEQEIQTSHESLLPPWIPKSREHIPDGFTFIKDASNGKKFAIEVDINLKPGLRYDKAAYYFDVEESQIDVVFWLCGSFSIAESIFERLLKAKLQRLKIHHFFLTDDYLNHGWNAVARSGHFKDKTLREIYLSNGYQTPIKELSRPWSGKDRQIFFAKEKSPLIKKV